jgi:aspartate-semialdehyde dehydrogenase
MFASGRGADREVTVAGRTMVVRPFNLVDLTDTHICFLAAGGDFSRRYARAIAATGTVVIDNSSALRMDGDVPLAVPEVNAGDISKHNGLIANPNCSTIQMVVVLAPLHRQWTIRKVVVSTYQAVTGAGLRASGELSAQTEAMLEGRSLAPQVFPHRIAFNLIPHIDRFDSEGWTYEERKMINETRKILGEPGLEVVATAVRVPVFRGHSESVYVEFEERVDIAKAREILRDAPGVCLTDNPARASYPMPLDCAGRDESFVGRLRLGPESERSLCMWIVSDNLRKGAALNAVQIAEELL